MTSIGTGIGSMGELIIVSLLAGGMLALIRYNGGLDFIINGLTRRIRGPRGAYFSIAGLVSLVNFCTANNTIAIITVGPLRRTFPTGTSWTRARRPPSWTRSPASCRESSLTARRC